AYGEEESAVRAYDLAALKYRGTSTFKKFPMSDYENEIDLMKTLNIRRILGLSKKKKQWLFKWCIQGQRSCKDNGNYNPFIKCDCSNNVTCHITQL
ncbi:hypothetical protein ABKV19_027385, partial [Rosa sericea]